MKKCLVCSSKVEPVISFGKMPIANGFLTQEQFPEEPFFDLSVGFCPACCAVQLLNLVDREKMFHENYAFFSSTSTRMAQHFKGLAEEVMQRFAHGADPFVVEIGSNDGIMLQNFAQKNIRHLGIEPSANVGMVAKSKGINTICSFFDEKLAREIVEKYGQADAFLGANVFCHIPYLASVFAGVKLLLKPKGVLIFEDPYLGDIIEKTSYDQIYDEHAFYFSLTSVGHALEKHGLEIFDVAHQEVHGGSMRYYISHVGAHEKSPRVKAQVEYERNLGLSDLKTYQKWKSRIELSKIQLHQLLLDLKGQGKRVVAYGATSKSTTVTNYCSITPDLVEFISDTTPIKQGKYSPGVHIPVKPYEEFQKKYPDYALLFAWNHAEEIMTKESKFISSGGRWIVYVPHVQTRT